VTQPHATEARSIRSTTAVHRAGCTCPVGGAGPHLPGTAGLPWAKPAARQKPRVRRRCAAWRERCGGGEVVRSAEQGLIGVLSVVVTEPVLCLCTSVQCARAAYRLEVYSFHRPKVLLCKVPHVCCRTVQWGPSNGRKRESACHSAALVGPQMTA
jgi:hypothetical protein